MKSHRINFQPVSISISDYSAITGLQCNFNSFVPLPNKKHVVPINHFWQRLESLGSIFVKNRMWPFTQRFDHLRLHFEANILCNLGSRTVANYNELRKSAVIIKRNHHNSMRNTATDDSTANRRCHAVTMLMKWLNWVNVQHCICNHLHTGTYSQSVQPKSLQQDTAIMCTQRHWTVWHLINKLRQTTEESVTY